jgi:hypothetical protein
MPYEHAEPISLDWMDKHRYDGHNSICQKLRDIYRMTDNEEIKLNCRIAMTMAKKMHEKLKEYKTQWDAQQKSKLETI